MIGLYATITVAVKIHCYSNIVLCFIQFSLIYKSTVITIILYRQNLSCGKGWNRTTIVGFSVRCIDQLCYLPNCAFCYGERTNSSRIVYNVLIEILQDYLWQCSNTRYYFGLSLTLTEPKINFNLDTLPNPLFFLPRIEIPGYILILE